MREKARGWPVAYIKLNVSSQKGEPLQETIQARNEIPGSIESGRE